jgi:hypothetical protein
VARLAQRAAEERTTIPPLEGPEGRAMGAVFARMKSIYGHLWSSNFRDDNQLRLAQADWLHAFRSIKATPSEVNRALDYCATRVPDMPNLPRFMDILRAQQYAARREAERGAGVALLPETDEQRKAREEKARQEALSRRDEALGHLRAIKAQLAG